MTNNREYLGNLEFIELYRFFVDSDIAIICAKHGLQSFFVPSLKTKFINKNACKSFTSPSGEDHGLILPGEAAKETLSFYHEPVNISCPVNINAPLMFRGAYLNRDLTYIDIKSCYYQLYRKLWLDVGWDMKAGKEKLTDVADFLADWKQARNAVPGLLQSDSVLLINNRKRSYLYTNKKKDNYHNPCLWSTLNMVLHELANLARRLGAIYIATDGYFFERAKIGAAYFKDILEGMRLKFETIDGMASIVSWQQYRINGYCGTNKTTMPYSRTASEFENPLHLVSSFDIDKMRTRIQRSVNKVISMDLKRFSDAKYCKWWSSL